MRALTGKQLCGPGIVSNHVKHNRIIEYCLDLLCASAAVCKQHNKSDIQLRKRVFLFMRGCRVDSSSMFSWLIAARDNSCNTNHCKSRMQWISSEPLGLLYLVH